MSITRVVVEVPVIRPLQVVRVEAEEVEMLEIREGPAVETRELPELQIPAEVEVEVLVMATTEQVVDREL
jgi:hypothetical protein